MVPMSTLFHDARVQAVEKVIGYTFVDPLILRAALQAAGHLAADGNKPLALLGDALLRLVFTEVGYKTGAARGATQNVISQKACNDYLAQRGRALGLEDYIYKNPSQGNAVSTGVMASTVEAIIGAVYIDSNADMDAVRRVVDAMNLGWH